MNDSYGNDPHLQEQAGAASVTLNPVDAKQLGVAAGDRIRLTNTSGELELIAAVADLAPPSTLVGYKGRWPSTETSNANLNVLHTPRKADMGESSSVHGVEVQVTRLGPPLD